MLSVKSVHQHDAGQYWCEVEHQGQTLSSNSAWITVEGGTLNTELVLDPRRSLTTPLVLQESLTSSRNHRMCPSFPTFPSTSPVLLLVLQGLWRCCGGSVEPKWENLDHHHLFSLSKVREPSAVPVHHGNYISSSRQCSHRPTDAVCNNVLDTHTQDTHCSGVLGGGGRFHSFKLEVCLRTILIWAVIMRVSVTL